MIALPLTPARAREGIVVAVAALGCLTLAFRSLAPVSVVPTALVGVIGLVAWRAPVARTDALRWLAVVGAGSAAFAATLALGDAAAPRVLPISLFAVTLAGVAEEAFFRRFLYGWLERWGAVLAIALTSVLFALIHVPVYGWSTLALNLAAGALLGWQRWATGTWTAPAATHVAANLVVFL